ncbi:MAG: hypothetical protein V7K38_25365, partial [Nostoc sp.]
MSRYIPLTNESTILHSPRREHSRKPEQFFELVEKLTFPVKSLLQAASLYKGRAILTSLATVPGYQ